MRRQALDPDRDIESRPANYNYSKKLTTHIDLYARCATCGHQLIDHHFDTACNWLKGYKFCKCDGFRLKV